MKKEITLLILMFLPIAVVYYSMKWTHDAVITMAAVTVICYSLLCWIYDLVIADFKWSWFVGKETNNCCSKMFDGLGFTLMFATITAALLICFSIFSPWGVDKMVLPIPTKFGNAWDVVYMVGAILGYLIFLPLGEEAFYRVFQANQWKGFISDVLISLAYAGMNYAGLVFIFDCWKFRLAFSGLAFLSALLLVSIRDNLNVVTCLMTRIGIALGVLIWIFYLYETVKNDLPRKQPHYFFEADVQNIWNPVA
jgi:membrane protease YdiL (CAAX protease family)